MRLLVQFIRLFDRLIDCPNCKNTEWTYSPCPLHLNEIGQFISRYADENGKRKR